MNFYRWCAEHTLLAKIILSVVFGGLYGGLWYLLNASVVFDLIAAVLGAILVCLWVSSCHMRFWKPAILHMNNECDPYPLLHETEKQKNYKMSRLNRQLLTVNACVAKRNLGQYEQVYEELMSLDLYENPAALSQYKVAYLNNLFDICILMEKYEQADIWYGKMATLYNQMKNGKKKAALASIIEGADVAYLYRMGEYNKALSILYRKNGTNKSMQVNDAMLYARICLKIGSVEKAKEKLHFVIENGNLFYVVTEAKKLLAEIEEEQ